MMREIKLNMYLREVFMVIIELIEISNKLLWVIIEQWQSWLFSYCSQWQIYFLDLFLYICNFCICKCVIFLWKRCMFVMCVCLHLFWFYFYMQYLFTFVFIFISFLVHTLDRASAVVQRKSSTDGYPQWFIVR